MNLIGDINNSDIEISGGIANGNAVCGLRDYKIPNTIVPTVISECSLASGKISTDHFCLSDMIVNEIVTKLKVSNEKEALNLLKTKTNCDSQVCLLEKMDNIVDPNILRKEIANNYKVKGPVVNELLNNFNIDNSLKQFASKFNDFYPCEFAMRDWDKYESQIRYEDLQKIYEQGYRSFGCVWNTDSIHGRGMHWVSTFVDMRNSKEWTVEFFNSSGNPPIVGFIKWLSLAESQLEACSKARGGPPVRCVIVSRFCHQDSRTECGVYSIYYIWARLNSVPFQHFSSNFIDDKAMFEFRQHLYQNSDNIFTPGDKFDWTKFSKTHGKKLKWENNCVSPLSLEV